MATAGRYEVRARLGAGDMGEVWRVFDYERGTEVALKRLTRPPGAAADAARALFEREFYTAHALRHPHLLAAYDFGVEPDGAPYFTMELLQGEPAPWPMAEATIRGWLPGIAAALGFLHGQGLVHGDVKPANLHLPVGGVAKLLDLGLLGPVGRVAAGPRGTPAYMAPEVFMGGAVDDRTDLYALGATLFELLTGRPPYAGEEGLLALAHAHMAGPVPRVRDAAPAISLALAEAVTRLLAKAPQDRYADADALLLDLGLAATGGPTTGLLGSPLVGLAATRAALHASLTTDGSRAVALAGPLGAGKSRVLAAAAAAAQLAGWTVTTVRAAGPDAAPYQACRPLMQQMLADAEPAARDRWLPVVARVLPSLAVAPADGLEGSAERTRLQAAMAELARSARPGRTVWLIDDGDRLDVSSRGLLDHLRGTDEGLPWAWWFTATDPGQLALPAVLALEPLSPAEVGALAGHLLGAAAPPVVLERLAALTGGRPGAVEGLLASWVRARVLRRDDGGWTVVDPALLVAGEAGTAGNLGWLPADLSADARHAVGVAALLGEGTPIAALVVAADRPATAVYEAIAALEAAGVVQLVAGSLAVLQPVRAAALQALLPAAAAATAHGLAARWLSARPGASPEDSPLPDVFAIAGHHLAGDAPPAGVPWAIAAARGALAMHAPGAAEPLLHRALEAGAPDPAARLQLRLLLAAAARYLGRVDEALALHEACASGLAGLPPAARAQATTTHGMLLQQKGRYPEAAAAYAAAHAIAAAAPDAREAARAALMAGRVAYFAGDPAAAEAQLRQSLAWADDPACRALRSPILSFLGYVVAGSGDARRDEGHALIAEAVAAAGAIDDLGARQEALNNQGNALLADGRLVEARETFDACAALCRRIGAPNETLFAELNAGVVRLELGQRDVAAPRLEVALAMARAQGRRFPEGVTLAYLGLARLLLGDAEAGERLLDEGVAIGQQLANAYLQGIAHALRAEARLARGRLADAAEDLSFARGLGEGAADQAGRLARVEAALAADRGEAGAADRLQTLLVPLTPEAAVAFRGVVAPASTPAAPGAADVAVSQLALVAECVADVAGQDGLNALLLAAVRALVELTGMARGFLLLYEDMNVTHRVHWGMRADDVDQHSTGLAREVAWTARPLFVADALNDAAWSAQASVQALSLRAAIGLPLLAPPAGSPPEAPEEVVGVMLADSQHAVAAFGPAEMAVAEAFARMIAATIVASQRTERWRTGHAEAEWLLDVATRLLAESDAEARWAKLAGAALALCGMSHCVVLAGPTLTPVRAYGAGGDPQDASQATFSRGIAGWVLAQGEVLQLLDAQSDEAFASQRSVAALGLRTVFAAPIAGPGGAPVGVLYLDSAAIVDPPPAAAHTLERLGRLAGTLGLPAGSRP